MTKIEPPKEEQEKKNFNPWTIIKKDYHFIIVILIATIFVLYSYVGSGTADAVQACNDHWIKEWNNAAMPRTPKAYAITDPLNITSSGQMILNSTAIDLNQVKE